jgi:glycosyltransferase involved in cell wall biosynthesis
MKNILFVSPTGTFDNGAEISIFNLMKYLVQQGYNIYNIAPQSYRTEQALYYDESEKNGIKTHFIPVLRWWWEDAPSGVVGTSSERSAAYRDNIREIRDYIQRNDIELVITNTINVFTGALAAACEEIPHYWLIHEFPTGEFSYYINKIDFISEYSDEIYCVTGELYKQLNILFPDRRLKTFSPFTDVKTSNLKVSTENRIVSVGRISERKNQLELIKAYQKSNINVPLVLIGGWDKEYKEILDKYIKKSNIKNVQFLGHKKNPWEEVSNRDICVFPSLMETYGLVYVEAILNGVPTILSDNPGHLSAFELLKFGDVYHLGDVESLENKILTFITHFDKYKVEALAFSHEAAQKYQLKEVYSEVLVGINKDKRKSLKSVRHIAKLLTENEKKSKLAKFEYKFRRGLVMIMHKIKRR